MSSMGYQYETSPRKLEPEYKPTRKNKSNSSSKNKKNRKSKKQLEKEKLAKARKNKFLITFNCLIIFSLLFVVILRNSQITQYFSQIQGLKAEIAELKKENDQLEISIQNSVNMSSIEQQAREQLGMQKLTSKQTIYLNLPKKDYVEPNTEEVVIEEKPSLFEYIYNLFEGIF